MEEFSFGEWLSRQRKFLGLTQKQFADRVNCATITVRKLEAEERKPSMQIIGRIAQVLNIPAEEQPAFYRFARGNDLLLTRFPVGNAPWQAQPVSIHPNLLASLIAHLGQDRRSSGSNSVNLDEKIHLVNQLCNSGSYNGELFLGHTSGAASNSPGRFFLLMLVPIQFPDELASLLVQHLAYDQVLHERAM